MTQDVVISPLGRADGSASYISNGYSVLAAVNGPVEVQRRDEIPEESAIDVVLRPAIGVGGDVQCFHGVDLGADMPFQGYVKDILNPLLRRHFDKLYLSQCIHVH